MADPADELERILADARAQLGRIRLELPDLEDGTPTPREVREWARASLGPALVEPVSPAAPAPVEVPSVSLEPEAPPPAAALPAPAAALPEPASTPAPAALRPSTPAPQPLARTPRPAQPAAPPLSRRLRAPAAVAAALALLSWALFRPGSGGVELPFADHDALAVDASGGVIAARGLRVERKGPDGATTRLADLTHPLRSLSWAADGLYGCDGTQALLRWRGDGQPPDRFGLDHAPLYVYASRGNVWTQDASGNIRQFLLNRSMTGVYLQPLDRAALPGGPVGAFAVDGQGAVLALDAAGAALRYEHAEGAYAAPARGRVHGAGASLVPAPAGARVLVPRADGAARLIDL